MRLLFNARSIQSTDADTARKVARAKRIQGRGTGHRWRSIHATVQVALKVNVIVGYTYSYRRQGWRSETVYAATDYKVSLFHRP